MNSLLYWECNEVSFERLKRSCKTVTGSDISVEFHLGVVEIRVNNQRPDGYFPVYDTQK